MSNLTPIRLNELKLQANFLLKDLKSNSERAEAATSRFSKLPYFAHVLSDKSSLPVSQVRLKHAYEVIALENDFPNWSSLRQYVVEKDCLYRGSLVAFVHSWFQNYAEAEAYLNKNGGYLLAFWNDFIICGPEYVKGLGLHSYQSYWERIHYNWIKPADLQAWELLRSRAKEIYVNQ
ncbi:hypothetical protein [Fulvivirga imtechensis]|nr:hypothetical protein [Fulvivirga imtechensis]